MFQLEMKEDAIVRRAACGISRVSAHRVMTGKLSEFERDRFTKALEQINTCPIYISDRTDWSTSRMRVEIARLKRDYGIKWFLVDYAGLLKDEGRTMIERENSISQGLHDIAKDFELAGVIVEQMNKAGKLYGSVQKEYDADVVLAIEHPQDAPRDKKLLRVHKAREADKNLAIPMRMVGSERRFELWEGKSQQEPTEEAEQIPF
jgi:hypothetical protein